MLRSLCHLRKVMRFAFAINPIQMPSLSPTMEMGKIQKWHVKEGDTVQMGDAIAEIETDKSAVTLEATDEAVIAKIVREAGDDSIKIGEIIAYSVDDASELKDFKVDGASKGQEDKQSEDSKKNDSKTDEKEVKSQPKQDAKKEDKAKPQTDKSDKPSKPAKAEAKALPPHNILKMPALSPTMKAGKITEWQVKEGQHVNPGDIIAVVETDKASVDYEIQEEGYIAKILVQADGESIDVGKDVVIIVDNEADVEKFADYQSEGANQHQDAEAGAEEKQSSEEQRTDQNKSEDKKVSSGTNQTEKKQTQAANDGDKVFISPKAKIAAQEKGIDYSKSNINGSGPNGRIIDQDIQGYTQTAPKEAKQEKATQPKAEKQPQQKKEQKPIVADSYEEIPLSSMRRVIAQRLTESKQNIPHYYLTSKIEMNALLDFKKKLQSETGLKFSVSDFLIKAVGFACQEVPEANSQWAGDKIQRFHDVDVSFAVDTGDGLITPIVKKVNLKTISAISKDSKDLINKAKEKKLKPDDYIGGTFTISNLGMMGIDCFSAVINPPQSCILAVGKTSKEPIYDESNENGFRFADVMYVTLSCDHRVVDGAVGSKWLQVFKKYIENPLLITL